MTVTKLRPAFTFDQERINALRAIAPEAFADGKTNWDALPLHRRRQAGGVQATAEELRRPREENRRHLRLSRKRPHRRSEGVAKGWKKVKAI